MGVKLLVFWNSDRRVPAVFTDLPEKPFPLHHSGLTRLMMIQPYKIAIAEFLREVWHFARHHMSMHVDLQHTQGLTSFAYSFAK